METLCPLYGDDSNEQGLPPGFRFHPTDEELITFYLASKVFNGSFTGVDIAEIDLNRCEPWELPDIAKMGEKEWYFFSLRDRKYPTGLRTNRATEAGYWKATGKDREIYSASTGALVGMKKTLVFYRGRAPKGEKTNWVMHEYRLDGYFSCCHSCKEEWVICRVLQKNASEKKIQIFHNQSSYFLEIPSPTNLPPLLESPTLESSVEISVNHYTIPRENDLENYFNPTIQTIPRNPIFPVDLPFSLVDCCSSKETSLIKLGKMENPSFSPFSLQEEPNSSNWFNRNKDLFHLSVSEFSSTNYAPAHSIEFQLDSPIIHGPSEMYQSSVNF